MTEPLFAQIKTNRHIGRFKRRGYAAARSEGDLSQQPTTCSSSTRTGSPRSGLIRTARHRNVSLAETQSPLERSSCHSLP
jgi:hypothetical protein